MQLSIIIVNYNTTDLTLNCLDSIYQTVKNTTYEIILVDNASTNNSILAIKQKFPKIIVIKNKENLGFGKANNQAAKISSGKWLLFLNSDTVLKPDSIDQIFSKTIEKDSINTIYGVKLLNSNDSIQQSAGYFPTIGRIFNQMLFIDDMPLLKNYLKPYQQSNLSFYNNNQHPDWITGAFFLISKELFNNIEGFDESIFMYGEEVDLCYRAKKQGAIVKYLSKPEIYHLKGKSSKNGFEQAILGEYKGLKTFYKKHFPKKIALLKNILKAGALLRLMIFAIISPSKSKTYIKAFKLI